MFVFYIYLFNWRFYVLKLSIVVNFSHFCLLLNEYFIPCVFIHSVNKVQGLYSLPVVLSVCLSVCRLSVVGLSVCRLSVGRSVCLSVVLSFCLSVCLCICLSALLYLSVYPLCLAVFFVCLCLFLCLSVCVLSVSLSAFSHRMKSHLSVD